MFDYLVYSWVGSFTTLLYSSSEKQLTTLLYSSIEKSQTILLYSSSETVATLNVSGAVQL